MRRAGQARSAGCGLPSSATPRRARDAARLGPVSIDGELATDQEDYHGITRGRLASESHSSHAEGSTWCSITISSRRRYSARRTIHRGRSTRSRTWHFQRIGRKAPTEYFPEIVNRRGREALESQLIPQDPRLLRVENYRDFLEARRSLLAEAINAHITATAKIDRPSLQNESR